MVESEGLRPCVRVTNSLSEREETELRNQDLDHVTCLIWPRSISRPEPDRVPIPFSGLGNVLKHCSSDSTDDGLAESMASLATKQIVGKGR